MWKILSVMVKIDSDACRWVQSVKSAFQSWCNSKIGEAKKVDLFSHMITIVLGQKTELGQD